MNIPIQINGRHALDVSLEDIINYGIRNNEAVKELIQGRTIKRVICGGSIAVINIVLPQE